MGRNVRGKHVRTNRKNRHVVKSEVDPCCSLDRGAVSSSIGESKLENLVYHPGLSDYGPEHCVDSNPSKNFEEKVLDCFTEVKLEDLLLNHLKLLYKRAISKLIELGYDEGTAMRGVLSNGHCYGELDDVLNNIVNNSLSYLNNSEDRSEADFTDLRDLEEYSLFSMMYLLQYVNPNLSRVDAMWCLLLSDLHVVRASTMDISPTSVNRVSCSKEDSNIEVDGSTLDAAGLIEPELCRCDEGSDFGKGGGPEFSGNGFSMNSGELKLQNEIYCPKKLNLSPSVKPLLKRNVAAYAAGFRASLKQKHKQSETSGIRSWTDPACVATCEQQRDSGNEESVSSVLEKFCDLHLDDNLELAGEDDKDGVVVTLLHQVKDLENKLKERKDWAQKKAMQAAQKVSDVLAELKSLSSHSQQLKNEKQAVTESTTERLSEMKNAVRKGSGQIHRRNVVASRLEDLNAETRAKKEGFKLSASESVKESLEASKKEKKILKKLVTYEKQKLKLQEEITAEKDKIKALYKDLAQIRQDEKENEVCFFMYNLYL